MTKDPVMRCGPDGWGASDPPYVMKSVSPPVPISTNPVPSLLKAKELGPVGLMQSCDEPVTAPMWAAFPAAVTVPIAKQGGLNVGVTNSVMSSLAWNGCDP